MEKLVLDIDAESDGENVFQLIMECIEDQAIWHHEEIELGTKSDEITEQEVKDHTLGNSLLSLIHGSITLDKVGNNKLYIELGPALAELFEGDYAAKTFLLIESALSSRSEFFENQITLCDSKSDRAKWQKGFDMISAVEGNISIALPPNKIHEIVAVSMWDIYEVMEINRKHLTKKQKKAIQAMSDAIDSQTTCACGTMSNLIPCPDCGCA